MLVASPAFNLMTHVIVFLWRFYNASGFIVSIVLGGIMLSYA